MSKQSYLHIWLLFYYKGIFVFCGVDISLKFPIFIPDLFKLKLNEPFDLFFPGKR